MKVRYGANTHIGLQRQLNQDSYGVSTPERSAQQGQLLVVCDGMGGHDSGEVASEMGVHLIHETFYAEAQRPPPEALTRAFAEANKRIFIEGHGNMGTTGVAALLYQDTLTIANVGDSRAYLFRNGHLEQISRDHSFVWEQVDAGVMTKEQARHSNYRNMITRALGHRPEVDVDTFTNPEFDFTLREGDTILLSSDGMHGLVEDDEIAEIVGSHPPAAAVEHLITLANDRGGSDNITAIIVRVEELDSTSGVETLDTPTEQDDDETTEVPSDQAETQPMHVHQVAAHNAITDPGGLVVEQQQALKDDTVLAQPPAPVAPRTKPVSARKSAPAAAQSTTLLSVLLVLFVVVVLLGGAYVVMSGALAGPVDSTAAPTRAAPTATLSIDAP